MAANNQNLTIQENRRRIEESIRAKKAVYSSEERKAALGRLCGALAGSSLNNVYDIRAERLAKQ